MAGTEREPAGGTLPLEPALCCLCGGAGEPVGLGEDFEYRTSADTFLAVRCPRCSLVFLDPRPTADAFPAIYPDGYHAFDFSAEGYGLAFRARAWLESRRLVRACRDLPPRARILDVGCGDGFHLALLRDRAALGWELTGVDVDPRAVAAARARGLDVRLGAVESVDLPEDHFDLALMIATVEHTADPVAVVGAVRRALRPGGRLVVVTDNTGSPDFRLWRRRYWGGYHFPRHLHLFDHRSLAVLAERTGFELAELGTITSPVNWTYSVRNFLDDHRAPPALVGRFTLSSPAALGAFTLLDGVLAAAGRGALLRAELVRPG